MSAQPRRTGRRELEASRRRGPAGLAAAWRALPAILLLAGAWTGAAAQTTLVVATEDGGPVWAERTAAVEAALRWSYGPVRVVHGAIGDAAAESAVVVPLLAVSRPADGVLSGPGVTAAVVWEDGVDARAVAQRIEHRAVAALLALVDAGRRPRPGVEGPVYHLRGLNVTATRQTRELFATPVPVTVLGDASRDAALAAAPADLFRDVPGLDVEGVGAQQRRPVVRGLRGQRVLLLADGLRLNNPRRRVDSGEPLGLIGPGELDRIEVVRGPASVLYGSDAIGGVINLVTRPLPVAADPALSGSAHLGWGSAGDRAVADAGVAGRAGPVAFRLAGGYRDSEAYRAPAGRFGDVVLGRAVRVRDSGARDRSVSAELGWSPAPGHTLFARYRGSDADDAGFGWVDPALFGEALPRVRILFPEQEFRRQVLGYRGHGLNAGPADHVELSLYRQTNDRHFVTDVFAPFGAPFPPGSHVAVRSENRTMLTSDGFRIEARKRAAEGVLLTYGLDLHRDRSENTDTSTTRVVIGAAPPRVSGGSASRVPTARLRSLGAFAQARLALGDATDLTVGTRYQEVRAEAESEGDVAGSEAHDRTVVGAANLLVRPADGLGLVLSVGRAFRSPNLVERFFSGPTPEGRGVWVRNPELGPETSLNVDLGARWRRGPLEVEAFVFRNLVRDGIRLQATGDTVDGAAVLRNVNVDELRIRGLELAAAARPGAGLTLSGSYTWLDGEDELDAERIVSESYGTKLTGSLRWALHERVWAEYAIRSQGARDDLVLDGSYVGETIPGFTVHALRAGLALPGNDRRLTIAVENLTDTLYAESLNVGFFRPEPGRRIELGVTVGF